MSATDDIPPVTPLAGFVFLDELLLLTAYIVAGAQLGGGYAAGITLGIVLPVAAAVIWGRWLAPRAPHRLPHPRRLAAKLAVVAVAVVLLVLAGQWLIALPVTVISVPLLSLGELKDAKAR